MLYELLTSDSIDGVSLEGRIRRLRDAVADIERWYNARCKVCASRWAQSAQHLPDQCRRLHQAGKRRDDKQEEKDRKSRRALTDAGKRALRKARTDS